MFMPSFRRIRRNALRGLLLAGFLLTACGADVTPTAVPTGTVPAATATTVTAGATTAPATATAAPATATSLPPTATSVPATLTLLPPTATESTAPATATIAAPGPNVVAVREFDFDFSPKVITVPVGTKVLWTNDGPTDHTVADKDVTWSSEILHKGDTYSHVFTSTGTVTVICTLHPDMVSTVIVK